jgi:hypothetical protein
MGPVLSWHGPSYSGSHFEVKKRRHPPNCGIQHGSHILEGPCTMGPCRDVGSALFGSHFLGDLCLLGPTLIGSHLGSYGEGPALRWMSCGSCSAHIIQVDNSSSCV